MIIKIDLNEASKFFNDLLSQLDGISQTMRFGDDGFEDAVNDQIIDIKQFVKAFRSRGNDNPTTPLESWHIFQAQIHQFLKAKIAASSGVPDFKHDGDLSVWLQDFIYSEQSSSTLCSMAIRNNDFYQMMLNVVNDIVNDIKSERINAPQTKLF